MRCVLFFIRMAGKLPDVTAVVTDQKRFAGKFYPQELINSGGTAVVWLKSGW